MMSADHCAAPVQPVCHEFRFQASMAPMWLSLAHSLLRVVVLKTSVLGAAAALFSVFLHASPLGAFFCWSF